ncbi:MAG: dTMP kinase [Oligoflexia bacterium]|nr:dTMP kinase [Oligoflexia bacterium]
MQEQLLTCFVHPPVASNTFFVSLEGIEGAGKSTQVKGLVEYWSDPKHGNYRVITLREPGGTDFGEALRRAILNQQTPLTPLAEAYLFASARAQLLVEKILPALLMPNTIVLLDRYIDSSLSYQGEGSGLGIDNILKIHSIYPLYFIPHITFYLQITPELSFERQLLRQQKSTTIPTTGSGTSDYFERQSVTFYRKLAQGMTKSVELFPERIRVIPGNLSVDEVFAAMIEQWELFIGGGGRRL